LLALVALGDGTLRFNELRRRVDGVSEKMLAQALRGLERDGFVERTAYAVIPPRVDYRLTPSGEQLLASAAGLISWLEQHTDEVLASQRRYDRRARRRETPREITQSTRPIRQDEETPVDGRVNQMSGEGN
jgi:DNA-binding HxlR family transcriptional regulator